MALSDVGNEAAGLANQAKPVPGQHFKQPIYCRFFAHFCKPKNVSVDTRNGFIFTML